MLNIAVKLDTHVKLESMEYLKHHSLAQQKVNTAHSVVTKNRIAQKEHGMIKLLLMLNAILVHVAFTATAMLIKNLVSLVITVLKVLPTRQCLAVRPERTTIKLKLLLFKTAEFVHRANTVHTKQEPIYQTAWTATIAILGTQCRRQKTASVRKDTTARQESKLRVLLALFSISKADDLWAIACLVLQDGFARPKRSLKIQKILETTILSAKRDSSVSQEQQRQNQTMIQTVRRSSASVPQDSNVRWMALPSQLAVQTASTNRTLLKASVRINAQLDIFAEAC